MPTPTAARVPALDIVRGCVVLAVVFMHSCQPPGPAYHGLNTVLAAVRMPVLLLISGTLMAGALREPAVAARRVWGLAWLLLVWTAVYVLVAGQPGQFLPELLLPSASPLWYVWALLVLFGAACALRGVPTGCVVLGVGLLSLAADCRLLDPVNLALNHGTKAAVFFFVGLYYGRAALPALLRAPGAVLLGCVVVGALAALADAGAVHAGGLPLLKLFERTAACGAVLCVAQLAATRYNLSLLVWLGQRTLPVFVAHPFFIMLLHGKVPGAAGPFVVAAAATAGSLLLHAALTPTWGRLLYTAPPLFKLTVPRARVEAA